MKKLNSIALGLTLLGSLVFMSPKGRTLAEDSPSSKSNKAVQDPLAGVEDVPALCSDELFTTFYSLVEHHPSTSFYRELKILSKEDEERVAQIVQEALEDSPVVATLNFESMLEVAQSREYQGKSGDEGTSYWLEVDEVNIQDFDRTFFVLNTGEQSFRLSPSQVARFKGKTFSSVKLKHAANAVVDVLDLRNTDIKSAMESLCERGRLDFAFGTNTATGANSSVSLRLRERTVREAIEIIGGVAGWKVEIADKKTLDKTASIDAEEVIGLHLNREWNNHFIQRDEDRITDLWSALRFALRQEAERSFKRRPVVQAKASK